MCQSSLVEADIRARITVVSQSRADAIQLPNLERLSFRANNIPILLDSILAPRLQRMHLIDLDGRRVGCVAETGQAIRRVAESLEQPLDHLGLFGLHLHPIATDSSGDLDWCIQQAKFARVSVNVHCMRQME
jgi:hypothetical protein